MARCEAVALPRVLRQQATRPARDAVRVALLVRMLAQRGVHRDGVHADRAVAQ